RRPMRSQTLRCCPLRYNPGSGRQPCSPVPMHRLIPVSIATQSVCLLGVSSSFVSYNDHIPVFQARHSDGELISVLLGRKHFSYAGGPIGGSHPDLTDGLPHGNRNGDVREWGRFALRAIAVVPFHGTGVTEIDQVHDIFVRKAPPISSHPALYGRSVGYRQSRTSSGHTGIHGVASVAEQILVGHHEIIIANELVFCRAAELQVIVGEVL